MKRRLRSVGVIVIVLILALTVGLALRRWCVNAVRISGTSMNDTLMNGDVVLVTRLDYTSGNVPDRGDIVECTFPGRMGTYIKRVVGLPGEKISFSDGMLTVNGKPISEPYVFSPTDDFSCTLGADEFLVLGDNRAESYDSRATDMGAVSADAFTGRVRWIIWPLSRFGRVE